MRKSVVYTKKHADSIGLIENPFASPEDMMDYLLGDYLHQIMFEIIEQIEDSIDTDKVDVTSIHVQQYLKEIPGRIIEFAHKNKGGRGLSANEEFKVVQWMLRLGEALDIDEASAKFYWEKAKAQRILELYCKESTH